MKVAIMQPYFLPYLGYFDLLNIVDEFIAFDTSQYVRHGWYNRNKILHPASSFWFISLPIKLHQSFLRINEIEISKNEDWKLRILRQLSHYKNDAPYYTSVKNFLENSFENLSNNLSQVNIQLLKDVSSYLGIKTPIKVFSEMNLVINEEIKKPGDWGWIISKKIGANVLINRPGGISFIDKNEYEKRGIKLIFQNFENMKYNCGKYDYIPDLSIIDVMMWNSPNEIKYYLDNWRINKE